MILPAAVDAVVTATAPFLLPKRRNLNEMQPHSGRFAGDHDVEGRGPLRSTLV